MILQNPIPASQVFCSPGISSRELFGPIRGVCRSFLRAVDAMPCAAARRDVAKACAGVQPGGGGEPTAQEGDKGPRERGEGESAAAVGLDPSFPDGDGGRRVGSGGGGGGGGTGGCWWDTVRARLVRGGGFTECAAGDILGRLEWAAEQEEDDEEGGCPAGGGGTAASSAVPTAADDHDPGGDTGEGAGGGALGGRRRRILRHLEATRALSEEWGLVVGPGGGGGAGGGSWSGWEAFGLAVATAASRDRLSLCCWAVRPLMGEDAAPTAAAGGGGDDRQRRRSPACPGLPRGEVIELLCLMLRALSSLEGGGARGGGGFVRLQADLLVCARVLENWDVR